uniref:Uncharacterized protein n=1 Tax=Panagrolaimus davidi TaxID=227884 RepID=A0A914QNE2_9BILA
MIVLRILKQAKFQKKHNKNDFHNSLRIAGVIVLQASINVFALFIVSFPLFMQTVAPYVLVQFPVWLIGSYGLLSLVPKHMISQIRVFLDAFIVLILMTGYREAIINFLKTVFFALKNPRKAFQKSKSYFRKDTSVTNQWF